MTDDTLIADLIRAGVSPDLVGRVANAIALSGTMSGTSAGTIREYHRNRKQVYRDKTRELQHKPEANDAGVGTVETTDMSRTVPDNRTNDSLTSSSESQLEKKAESPRSKKELVEGRRGVRLKEDWKPSDADREFARGCGLSTAAIDKAAAEFVDYWIAVPGQRGTKTNWPATWRNRIRQLKTGKPNGVHHGKRSLSEEADQRIAQAEKQQRAFDLDPADYHDAGDEAGERHRR